MEKENKYSRIDVMTERYLVDRNDNEAISFLKDAAMESEESRKRIRRNIELWFSSSESGRGARFNKDAAYARFLSRKTARQDEGKGSRRNMLGKYSAKSIIRVAAAVILIAALPWMGYRFAKISGSGELADVCISTPNGSISEVTLPDGTKVWLNACSKIEYSKDFGADNRNVKLPGEACFDVKKNENLPFCVNSKSADLKVLGTKFTYRDYPDDKTMMVQLIRGHVDIESSKTGRHIRMQKDETMTLDKQTGCMTKRKTDTSQSDSWVRGEQFFDEVPLQQIAKTLERAYNVKITVAPQMQDKTFYISFNSSGMDINAVLRTMAETNRMKFRKTNDGNYYLYQ